MEFTTSTESSCHAHTYVRLGKDHVSLLPMLSLRVSMPIHVHAASLWLRDHKHGIIFTNNIWDTKFGLKSCAPPPSLAGAQNHSNVCTYMHS